MGDNVLVLVPSNTNKLLARWQGPYPVKNIISPVTYEIDMFDKKRKRVFHINMLRRWNTPTIGNLWTEDQMKEEVEQTDDVVLWKDDGTQTEEMKMGDQLTGKLMCDLFQLMADFNQVMCDTPGKTDIIDRDIETGTARPI